MAKLLKITGRTLGILIEWLLICIIAVAFAIRSAKFQTYIAQQATNYLSKELKTTVKVDGISIVFFDEIAIEGVLIEDLQHDTLIAAETIFATIKDFNLKKNHFTISKVLLDKANIHIVKDNAGELNLQFLKDYFRTEKSSKAPKPVRFDISDIELSNSKFAYHDQRKAPMTIGFDHNHIKATAINAKFSKITILDDDITAQIDHFSAIERSGFHLLNLTANANVSGTGVRLKNLKIVSDKSEINAPKFNLLAHHYDDFNYFIDSVGFDASIAKSLVSMEDVALFAHNLDGMNDIVTLSVNISNKVNNLKLSNLDLRFGKKSVIQGTFKLVDFANLDHARFEERLTYAYVDIDELENLRMPNSMGSPHLALDERVNRLEYFKINQLSFDGYLKNFVIDAKRMETQLGTVYMKNGLQFDYIESEKALAFTRPESGDYDFKVDQFDLGAFMNNDQLGKVNGTFFVTGIAKSTSDIKFTNIEGDLDQFDFMGYAYTNIFIKKGSFIDQVFTAEVDIKDDALDLTYNGYIDLKGDQQMKFTVDIARALLEKIGVSTENSNFISNVEVNILGKDPNNYKGNVIFSDLEYTQNGRKINVDRIDLNVERGLKEDRFTVKSTIANAEIVGKLNFDYLWNDVQTQLSRVFPALFKRDEKLTKKGMTDHFTYELEVLDASTLLEIFAPDLQISENTIVKGHYFGETSDFLLDLQSSCIAYQGMDFYGVDIHQKMDSANLLALYKVANFDYNDSISFANLELETFGGNNELESRINWDKETEDASEILWKTNVKDFDHFDFELEPSYFSIKNKRWEIANASVIQFETDTVRVSDFKLQRGLQSILINGQISENDADKLRFEVNDVEIDEIVSLFTDKFTMSGQLNAWGYISNPTKRLRYVTDAHFVDFSANGQEVGDIFVQSEWNEKTESIELSGDLMYRGVQTFDFLGKYAVNKAEDNLDFSLVFDQTDIQFTNAFMDPNVVSEIRGFLNGTLKVTGTPDEPVLDGKIDLDAASANVGLLGAHFGVDGPIEVDKYGFYINSIPIFDEEGNAGSLIGSVYHDNFTDFNFDLLFDLEVDAINRNPLEPWRPIPLDRFLVMNSSYSPDEVYYGKAYVTGIANIFGYADNLEITVNVTSEKGTKVNFPMYGVGEIEEESFITFASKDTTVTTNEPRIDFLGVDLDLNLKVTPDAELKLIFDEELGDIITANGSGDLSIKVDNLGDLTMDGVFTVASGGVYDFAMGPIVKQKFFIQEGGSIAWTGDPYNANLDLKTYFKVNANIGELSPGQLGNSASHEEIQCFLNLQETLLSPAINFDIKAPKATDQEQALLNRVKSDRDELNRQFFSMILWKKFQPLQGSATVGGNAAVDLIANQINSLLDKVSKDYKLNVNLDNDQLTGDNTYEFGVQKGFLDDRLILSGSFGVESQKSDNSNGSSIIGDVNLEYLLNESGTFRVNIFNESNNKSVIQDQQQGQFTQGVGIHYQEDFNTVEDFKAIQVFLDIFRSKENKRITIKRKKRQTPVPTDKTAPSPPKEAIETEP